jgi:hypothetical protein
MHHCLVLCSFWNTLKVVIGWSFSIMFSSDDSDVFAPKNINADVIAE